LETEETVCMELRWSGGHSRDGPTVNTGPAVVEHKHRLHEVVVGHQGGLLGRAMGASTKGKPSIGGTSGGIEFAFI
jgi:hypothetical protein